MSRDGKATVALGVLTLVVTLGLLIGDRLGIVLSQQQLRVTLGLDFTVGLAAVVFLIRALWWRTRLRLDWELENQMNRRVNVMLRNRSIGATFRAEITDIPGQNALGLPWPLQWEGTIGEDQHLAQDQTGRLELVRFQDNGEYWLLQGHAAAFTFFFPFGQQERGVYGNLGAHSQQEYRAEPIDVRVRVHRLAPDETYKERTVRLWFMGEPQIIGNN